MYSLQPGGHEFEFNAHDNVVQEDGNGYVGVDHETGSNANIVHFEIDRQHNAIESDHPVILVIKQWLQIECEYEKNEELRVI